MKLATPLGRQQLLRALLFIALFCLLVLCVQLYLGQRSKQQLLLALPQRIEQQTMPLLAQSVWDVDQAATRDLLQSLLREDAIRQLRLSNSQGGYNWNLAAATTSPMWWSFRCSHRVLATKH